MFFAHSRLRKLVLYKYITFFVIRAATHIKSGFDLSRNVTGDMSPGPYTPRIAQGKSVPLCDFGRESGLPTISAVTLVTTRRYV